MLDFFPSHVDSFVLFRYLYLKALNPNMTIFGDRVHKKLFNIKTGQELDLTRFIPFENKYQRAHLPHAW